MRCLFFLLRVGNTSSPHTCCNRHLYKLLKLGKGPYEASVTLENGMSLGTLTYACVVTGGRAAWAGCNDALQSTEPHMCGLLQRTARTGGSLALEPTHFFPSTLRSLDGKGAQRRRGIRQMDMEDDK